MANAATGGRGGFKASDFMPRFDEPASQSIEAMQAILLGASKGAATAASRRQPVKGARKSK